MKRITTADDEPLDLGDVHFGDVGPQDEAFEDADDDGEISDEALIMLLGFDPDEDDETEENDALHRISDALDRM